MLAEQGLVRSFQNVLLIKRLKVLENLLVAQHTHMETGLLKGLLKTHGYKQSKLKARQRAADWLDYMEIREYAGREAGNPAYGHQRRLEIARCMITQPRLLMLVETAAELNPQDNAR